MRKTFYLRLAADNMRKSRQTYLPYLLTCVITVAMYYVIHALSQNSGLMNMPGGGTMRFTLELGTVVVAIFAVIFLFYTNSFLIRRRKRELGLLNILGMEKKHLARVMLYETLYTALIALVIGFVVGIVLYRLMYLLLMNILHYDIGFQFEFSIPSILATLILFCVIFLLTFLNSLRQIHLAQPIELLRGDQIGEREPRTRVVLLILGILCLAAGYTISLTVKDTIAALLLFFVAVVLVIVGTYCIFTTGSIALLKLMRKNKNYYYQTHHFISVSGMIYRMKQNAVGLANICVLSTMVLVPVSATTSLYIGMEDVLMNRYPKEVAVTLYDVGEESRAFTDEVIDETAQDLGITLTDRQQYRYLSFATLRTGDSFQATTQQAGIDNSAIWNLILLPLADYAAMTGHEIELEEGQALVFGNREPYTEKKLHIGPYTYDVQEVSADFAGFNTSGAYNSDLVGSFFVILPQWRDIEQLNAYQAEIYGGRQSVACRVTTFDVEGTLAQKQVIYDALSQRLQQREYTRSVESREYNRFSFYTLYGGFFYLGIFLGLLFIMATVLIMYYKQISEGYDDKTRFAIMRKVGLSRRDIRRSVRSQVLTMFFLPLVTACVHIAFAFPVITRLLAIFNLTDAMLFLLCTLASIGVFAVFYAAVYTLTARVYYRIVGQDA